MSVPSRSSEGWLAGEHVFITGGSSGIGLALACQAAEAGARVSLVARTHAKLIEAREEVHKRAPGASVFLKSTDVSLEREISAAITAAEALHGPVDRLIASAGVARPGYFEEVPVEVFERTMAVNYFGSLYPAKLLVPAMRARRRGTVVFISSGAGLYGFFGYTPYSPSKFAVRGLAEALRAETRGSGIHVCIVYPPDTDTPQLVEENRTKPVETKAITARGGLWTAEAVAQVTWKGIRDRRFSITPGFRIAALARFHSLLAPLLHWTFDRTARRARRTSEKARLQP